MPDVKQIYIPDFDANVRYAVTTKETEELYKSLRISSDDEISHIAKQVSVLDGQQQHTELEKLFGTSQHKEFLSISPPENYPFFFFLNPFSRNEEIDSETLKVQHFTKKMQAQGLSRQALLTSFDALFQLGKKVAQIAQVSINPLEGAAKAKKFRLQPKRYSTLPKKERRPLLIGRNNLRWSRWQTRCLPDTLKKDRFIPLQEEVNDTTLQRLRLCRAETLKGGEQALCSLLQNGIKPFKEQVDETIGRMMQFIHE